MENLLQPSRLLERYRRYQKLAIAAKVPENDAKKWLTRQAL